jgi:hydroxypyruvate isomerase
MPRFAANLTFLFGEHPFLERFAAARAAGFTRVEYMFPYDYDAGELRALLDEHGLDQVQFNLPAGDWAAGDRGIAADPARVDEFRAGVEQALTYARALEVSRINCLAGKRGDRDTLVANVRHAAQRLAEDGRTLLVEPVNTRDVPGFLVATNGEAIRLMDEVGAPNLQLQFDIYHTQVMEGDLVNRLRALLSRIGHVQLADNPGRHQPGTGEIDFAFVLGELDAMGYDGVVGLEYVPEPDTLTSLSWLERHGAVAAGER